MWTADRQSVADRWQGAPRAVFWLAPDMQCSLGAHGLLQELHADSPHGPWAFVLSLTDWEQRGFTGGETTIFQPYMLNFWPSFDPDQGFEFKDMVCCHTGSLLASNIQWPHLFR